MSNMAVYQLFQMKDTAENQPYLFKAFSYITEHGGSIHESRYQMVYEGQLLHDMSICAVRHILDRKPRNSSYRRALSISDVIVIRRADDTDCFFIDPVGMVAIPGFFTMKSSGTCITEQTKDHVIIGKPGTWNVIDSIIIEQSMFFLLESTKFGRDVPNVILDSHGDIVVDDCMNDFDDDALRQIRLFMHPEPPKPIVHTHKKPEMEPYQRYYENGEYVRAASTEYQDEANYNMVDDMNNNSDPRKRPSVRKRLAEKLALIHSSGSQTRERIKE